MKQKHRQRLASDFSSIPGPDYRIGNVEADTCNHNKSSSGVLWKHVSRVVETAEQNKVDNPANVTQTNDTAKIEPHSTIVIADTEKNVSDSSFRFNIDPLTSNQCSLF